MRRCHGAVLPGIRRGRLVMFENFAICLAFAFWYCNSYCNEVELNGSSLIIALIPSRNF